MTIDSSVLYSKLKEFFGFDSFKADQERIIKHLVGGNNAFVLMPTGGGKSLCYQLPALVMEGTAIVISPLIALMKNQVDAIRGFVSGNDGIAHFLNSSLNKAQLMEVRRDLLSGATKLLYVAPESLTKAENVALLKEIKISFYAVDEAHCISEWGHDFRPEYRRIRTIIDDIGFSPIIALTANATTEARENFRNNGLNDFVAKPIKVKEIYKCIRKWLPEDKLIIGTQKTSVANRASDETDVTVATDTEEILGIAAGSVAGGFIGGCLVDKKENRKAKQREILSQMVGNIAVPVFLVGQGARLYGKYENRIENAMPQFKLEKITNGTLKKAANFTNKFMKVLPNAACTVAFLGVGIYVGNKVSNFINEKLYKKEVDREIRATDFAPHFDDLCMAISMMNKSSSVGSLLGRFIPLALLVPGYQTGITQEDK